MMQKILMIHDVDERLFELPLHEYTLTFDDGLISQYHHIERINEINTKKIFFITTGYVGKQNYMDLQHIREILSMPNCELAGHSHNHIDVGQFANSFQMIKALEDDTKAMYDWFFYNLGIRPTKYCFPYNKEYNILHRLTIKRFGITEFYGRERIPVETLLHDHS